MFVPHWGLDEGKDPARESKSKVTGEGRCRAWAWRVAATDVFCSRMKAESGRRNHSFHRRWRRWSVVTSEGLAQMLSCDTACPQHDIRDRERDTGRDRDRVGGPGSHCVA